MTFPLLTQILCALFTAGICRYLIHHYRKTYSFSALITRGLTLLALVLSFCFGYFQVESHHVSTYLEMLLIGPLLFLCATDLKALELPDGVNLLVGILGICYLFVAPFPFTSGLLTALILFVSFFCIAFVSGGALGGGDIKYVLAFGLWIPTHLILPFLLFSTLSASVYGVISLIFSRKKEPLPFGPFLVLSSIYLLFLF